MAKPHAPGALRVVHDFANTLDVEAAEDRLGTREGAREWLSSQGLLDPGAGLDERGRKRLIQARDALRRLLLANDGGPLDPGAVVLLNRLAAEAPLVARFDPSGGAEFAPGADGARAALARIVAAVVDGMRDGTWPRLKICREDTCQWAYYDVTRNRSGAWCSMEVCGNRAKARAFRARRRRSGSA